MKSLASDNYAGIIPEVMTALTEANRFHAQAYGNDEWTRRCTKLIQAQLKNEAQVHFVFNGTGANIFALSTGLQSFHAVLWADCSHIYTDEITAPGTFTGCRFFPIATEASAKLKIDAMEEFMIRKGDVHYPLAKFVSITQATELGTCYSLAEIKALSNFCKKHDLYLHLDGSRMWNAMAHLDCQLHELITETGVDIFSMGATKAGAMYGEAVVILNEDLKKWAPFRQKQSMQLPSKTRFIAAQIEALLTNNTAIRYASKANASAKYLAAGLEKINGVQLTTTVQSNAVFAKWPESWNKSLLEILPFYQWDAPNNEVRLMCAWDTNTEELDRFIAQIKSLAV